MRFAVAALFAVGCGRSGFDLMTPDVHSGTRLKLEEYDFGTVRVSGDHYFDAQRGEECNGRLMADGTYRCVPYGAFTIGGIYYLDDTCATPVAFAAALCDTPPYIHVGVPGCDNPLRLYHALPIAATQLYQRVSGGTGCSAAIPTNGGIVFSLADEVSPNDLVEMSRTAEPVTARMSRMMWSTADGLRDVVRDTYFDQTLQTPCNGTQGYTLGVPSPGICRPERFILNAYWFADASCSVPVAEDYNGCGDYHFAAEFGTCGLDLIYEASEVAPPIYDTIGMTCAPAPLPDGRFFAFGKPVEMMPVTYALPDGEGRFVRLVQSIDGVPVGEAGIYDRLLGAACYIDRDGLCVPIAANVLDAFADAACTAPDRIIESGGDCESGPTTYGVVQTSCHTDVYRVGAQRSAPFYTPSSNGCVELKPPSPIVTYDVGDKVTTLGRPRTRIVP